MSRELGANGQADSRIYGQQSWTTLWCEVGKRLSGACIGWMSLQMQITEFTSEDAVYQSILFKVFLTDLKPLWPCKQVELSEIRLNARTYTKSSHTNVIVTVCKISFSNTDMNCYTSLFNDALPMLSANLPVKKQQQLWNKTQDSAKVDLVYHQCKKIFNQQLWWYDANACKDKKACQGETRVGQVVYPRVSDTFLRSKITDLETNSKIATRKNFVI